MKVMGNLLFLVFEQLKLKKIYLKCIILHKIRNFYKVLYGTNKILIHFSDKRTVSIKRTVWNLFKKSLLNVQYDPYIGKIIG